VICAFKTVRALVETHRRGAETGTIRATRRQASLKVVMRVKRQLMLVGSIATMLVGLGSTFLRPSRAQSALTLALEPVVSGLSLPVFVTHAGDGSDRLFIVEQEGRIRVFQNGAVLNAAFLDIRPLVTSGGERGFLSVAFHPDYQNNRRFFVNYTASRPNLKTIIAEYRTSAANPNVADTAERVLLEIDQPFDNHNGGQLHFGPDGYLYIGMGDGGSAGDPQNHAQNLNSLLGKLLRIDVDAAQPYVSPSDNPFVGVDGRDEIWAYGLRNPWRFSFDRANGRLFLADVGQSDLEEVDLITRGGNYGWRIMEGTNCYSPPAGCNAAGLILPINDYGRSLGSSVTGGYVYRGSQFPELAGIYIFSDYGSSRIWGLTETTRGTWTRSELLRPDNLNISSFGEDEAGEIYVVNHGGSIHHLRVANPQPVPNSLTLIPSSVHSDRFTSLLSVVNREDTLGDLRVTAYGENGLVRGSLNLTLPPGGAYRSGDILGDLGLPLGSFGPITVEATNGRLFDAVSEVASNGGTAGFFSGQKVGNASTGGLLAEVIDSGDRGTAGTFRTNLGINNPGETQTSVQVSLFDGNGSRQGTLTVNVPARGMTQINRIASTLAGPGATLPVIGYLLLSCTQPIHAWASKIDNRTDDPSMQAALGDELSDTGTKMLIPSVAGTDPFKSLLVVVNRENEANQILITARNSAGNVIGTLTRTLLPAATFRDTDILGEMGAPLGSFGPLTIESTNGRLLSAVSEVRSTDGTAGFFPAVNTTQATLRRIIAEAVDTGDRGVPNTFRTNLGLNNPGPTAARVTLQMVSDSGELLTTSQVTTVPANGMVQLNNILRHPVFGLDRAISTAYLKISSDQAIHAWASKINNGTNDPSILFATP
jgi:glucose/arabinose dehydrogenase